MLKGIQWCFFDLGGTLVDKAVQEEAIINTIVEEFKKDGAVYSYKNVVCMMKRAAFNYLEPVSTTIRQLSSSEEQYVRIRRKAIFDHNLAALYPGVEHTLSVLSQRYELGVIANQSLGAEDRLKKHNIHKYFSVFSLSAELGVSKPDIKIFEYALNKAECKPEQAVMIGDRLENDIAPAKSIGMNTIRVLQGLSKVQIPKTTEYIPSITVKNISDILDYI